MRKIIVFLMFIFICKAFEFENLSANFTQNVSSKSANLNYAGFFVITPKKAFWRYEKPENKEIYINENEVIIVEHELEQAIISSLESIPNLSEIFKNAKKINDNEFLAEYENVKYKIQAQNEEIKSISYKDDFDNVVLLNFFNQKKNSTINEEILTPKVPKNYDLLR